MPVPQFTHDGVLPPFIGPNGPGGHNQDLSPYEVSALEVAVTFGTSEFRRTILRGWLDHRARLRDIGLTRGFQWLDGSFVEAKEPRDLDVVSFVYRPASVASAAELLRLMQANIGLFERKAVKRVFHLDLFMVDLLGSPETTVETARYFLGLFSHRREDGLWKGMLKVRLEDRDDDAAAMHVLQAFRSEDGAAADGDRNP